MDEALHAVREWLKSQPFHTRMVTLIVLMSETVEDEYGKEVHTVFENDLKEAYRKVWAGM